MALASLSDLDGYLANPLPSEFPAEWCRVAFSNRDDVAGLLRASVAAATISIDIAMYAFTDTTLVNLLVSKLADPGCWVRLTLDASQAKGATEAGLDLTARFPASDIAVGHSPLGSIIHHKTMIVDGQDTYTGSTNWSPSGERPEANDLIVIRDAGVAAYYSAYLGALHSWVAAHPVDPTGSTGEPPIITPSDSEGD